jgi:hypothetical protein
VLGVPMTVVSDVGRILSQVDETYAAFRAEPSSGGGAFTVWARRAWDGTVEVGDSDGYEARGASEPDALVDLLASVVRGLLRRFHARGVHAIHAAALAHSAGALIVAGPTGYGKTTLALGLVRRGLSLLSDEVAVVEPKTSRILPYRRSLHIRPGALQLIPELGFLHDRPRRLLGGGIEWTLTPWELERTFPGALGTAAPLTHVLLLAGGPDARRRPSITRLSAAVAAVELLTGTFGTAIDFRGSLDRVSALLGGATCGRLTAGELDATAGLVVDWLGGSLG